MADQQKEALRTLFRIDYNRCVLKARTGHPGYANWLQRRPPNAAVPEHGSAVYPLYLLVDAVRRLPEGNYTRHALGSLAASFAMTRDLSPGGVDEPTQLLRPFFDNATFEAIRFAIPKQAYVLGALGSTAACDVNILDEPFEFDNFDVTTAGIDYTCSRPVRELPVNFDPRLWDVRAPEVFRAADRIDDSPEDTRVKPPRKETPSEELVLKGQPWQGLLYENAVASEPGDSDDPLESPAELMEFKNVLSIRFAPQITGPESTHRIELDYQLHEGLSLQLFDSETFAGGLDRDSGLLRVNTIAGGSWHRVTKSLRVTQPEDRRELLNWDIAIALQFWLYSMTVLGVCAA